VKNLSVHIVEDEIIIALDLEDILEDMGHTVDISYTVKDALRRVQETTSDLFLIDIHLHGGDRGLEIGRKLQERNIPHIYISAYTDEETKSLAQRTNSLGYLNKPFNEREFKELLENASDRLRNEKL